MTAYAELQVTSNFSFLRGGSHPHELVAQAARLGLAALALTDRNSVAGVVRAHVAARAAGLKLLPGARLDLMDGPSFLWLPRDRAGWGRLCRLLSLGRRRAPKGDCHLYAGDLADWAEGQQAILIPPENLEDGFAAELPRWRGLFGDRLSLAASHLYRGQDGRRLARLAGMAQFAGIPLVAVNDVHYHAPDRSPLQDVLACIREKTRLDQAGGLLFAHAERHLKPPREMARLFLDHPAAIARTVQIAGDCQFSLDALGWEYPVTAPDPQAELTRRTWEGAARRWPDGAPGKVRAQLDHELALIGRLEYAPYFLTVAEIVEFARARGILCQGRGSAANSAVCYALGITNVDPARFDLLFERFVSAARGEPPDIDVDFEHERREEVIQHIYQRWGRDHAGLAATQIRYRARSALRDVGKVFGFPEDVLTRIGRGFLGHGEITPERVAEAGLDPADPALAQLLALARQLTGFPRHLSQHVGGFVITRGRLDEVTPVENAAMEDRTIIPWDKDDVEALGILKMDVLGLGMLTCIRRCLGLLRDTYGLDHDLASIPAEDPAVYDMLCRADSIGVFQVESRAQMAMLPRLRPRCFYDLVIEVAIVRPGPIQGDMVHPYLRRRMGLEKVTYPSDALRRVLEKTLGVPLFQEQAMQVAMVGAGFTAEEADQLRKSMATFRANGTLGGFRDKFLSGMARNGYTQDFAERCFAQLEGFGSYGFPESHAASFAHLVYVSAWLKCHYPEAFAAALLNSQPMGFYAPAQIVADARAHGVAVRPADVAHSDWDCTLEPTSGRRAALRLGLRLLRGLSEADGRALVAARGGGFADMEDLWRRAGIGRAAIARLADADAFGGLGADRRRAAWDARALPPAPLPLFAAEAAEPTPAPLPALKLGEAVVQDYQSTGLSLKAHPLALLRPYLPGCRPCAWLADARDGAPARLAGIVILRQRPGTAKGIIFMTIEDESGQANLVIYPDLLARLRRTILTARLVELDGHVQRAGPVIHVLPRQLTDRSALLAHLSNLDPPLPSRDFR